LDTSALSVGSWRVGNRVGTRRQLTARVFEQDVFARAVLERASERAQPQLEDGGRHALDGL